MRATSLTFTCGDCHHSASFSVLVVEQWLAIPPYEALIASDVDRLRGRLVCTACRSRNVMIATDEQPPIGTQPHVELPVVGGATWRGLPTPRRRSPARKPAPRVSPPPSEAPKARSRPSRTARPPAAPLPPRSRPAFEVPPQRLTPQQERIRAELEEIERRRAQRAHERALAQEGSSIPEYEEGIPRPGWFTDEDWRRLHPGRR
jgi:hypothetical protein